MRIFVLTATYELRVSRKNHLRDHPSSTACVHSFFWGDVARLCDFLVTKINYSSAHLIVPFFNPIWLCKDAYYLVWFEAQ
jgi:hypothetical protein